MIAPIKIRERESRDPGGKRVDVYPHVTFVSAITMDQQVDIPTEDVSGAVLEVFGEMRESGQVRIRDRDLPVFFGQSENPLTGDRLFTLALPEVTPTKVHLLFQDAASSLGGHFELGRAAVRDVQVTPFARYVAGKYILYGTPMQDEQRSGPWEVRSFELTPQRQRAERRVSMPPVAFEAARVHNLQSWPALAADISSVVAEMTGAASYAGLRRVVQRHFGINVREIEDAQFPRFGSLNPGWLSNDGCEVNALVRKSLPSPLKYAVLAHELGHFVEHFPLLYLAQAVEQMSWETPSLRDDFDKLIAEHLRDLRALEHAANIYATYLLIPPMYDLNAMAGLVLERGRPLTREDLAWRFLQPLFLEGPSGDPSWSHLDETRERAIRESSVPPNVNSADAANLHLSMIQALMVRDSAEGTSAIQSTREDLQHFVQAVFDLLGRVASNQGADSVSEKVPRAVYETGRPELSPLRQVLPPTEVGVKPALLLPLVPARSNRERSDDGGWQSVFRPRTRPRSVPEWKRENPGRAIALYRYMRPPPADFEWPTTLKPP